MLRQHLKLGRKDGGGQDPSVRPAGAAGPAEEREGGASHSVVCYSSILSSPASLCGLIVVMLLPQNLQPPHQVCDLPDTLSINPSDASISQSQFLLLETKNPN